ncbi:MAG: hypothetical protein ABWX65_07175 [Mycetocola sp.]
MSNTRVTLRITGIILATIGLCGLLGAAFLAVAPGFQLAPPASFGQEITVDLPAGDHAVYVTPSDRWGSIVCVGETDEGEVQLRPDMTQQNLLFPTRWDARGSFAIETAGAVTFSCDGPVSDAQFTVGPVLSFLAVAGAALIAAASSFVVLVGLVLVIQARRRRQPRATTDRPRPDVDSPV